MPATRLSEDILLDRLVDVFRRHGYEGASLSRISEATGLQRASLYHRFPGGKEEMARAVLGRADAAFAEDILAPLAEDGDPAERLERVARGLDTFYVGGRCACLLDTLSLGDPGDALRDHVDRSTTAWIDAFARMAREAGHGDDEAHQRAQDAVARVQGALVLARATGDTAPMQRTLRDLPALLLD